MENIQIWHSSGLTDFNLFVLQGQESNETGSLETYYSIEGILRHEIINSISRLKYRFFNEEEALNYYNAIREHFPTAQVHLTKITSQVMKGFY